MFLRIISHQKLGRFIFIVPTNKYIFINLNYYVLTF